MDRSLVGIVLLVAFAVVQPLVLARVPIGSAVRLFASLDQYTSICNHVLDKTSKVSGSEAINFLPTQHYVDDNWDFTPDRFCISKGMGQCEDTNDFTIKKFEEAMTYCFKKAYHENGFRQFEITPRLDDITQRTWRNEMRFDPKAKYGTFSYEELLIAPIVRAINKLPSKNIKVFFNIQGEMNGPLITHPDGWKSLVADLNKAIKAQHQVGINLNFNKMCAWCTGNNYMPNSANQAEQFDNKKIQDLFNSVDFIGMSAYAPLVNGADSSTTITPQKLEYSIEVAAAELSAYGIDLQSLNTKGGKGLRYSEFGLGAGTCGTGNCPAQTVWDVAKMPYFGIFGDYNSGMDPFKVWDIKAFRKEYYKNTIKYLANTGKNKYKVDGIFIWCHGSYDVQGVYPGSANDGGSWEDKDVMDMIFNWNKNGAVPAN